MSMLEFKRWTHLYVEEHGSGVTVGWIVQMMDRLYYLGGGYYAY